MPNPHNHPTKGKGCVHHPKPFVEGDAAGFIIIYGENFKASGIPKFKKILNIDSKTKNYIWAWKTEEFKNNYIDITAVPIHVAVAPPKTDGSDDITITIQYDDDSTEDVCVCDLVIAPPEDLKGKKKNKDGKKAAAQASTPKK